MFQEVQNWLTPLLYLLSAITAIVAFVRLCKPILTVVSLSKETTKKVGELEAKMDAKFDSLNQKLQQQDEVLKQQMARNKKEDSICLNLLHDSIIQIYQNAQSRGSISEIDYYRACELYKQNGNSQYIDGIMKSLDEMYSRKEQ